MEKLQEERLETSRHAEDLKLALEQANVEYEANLEKIKLSHAYELEHAARRQRGASGDLRARTRQERDQVFDAHVFVDGGARRS